LPQQLSRAQGVFAASGAPAAAMGHAAHSQLSPAAYQPYASAPAAAAQESMVIEVSVAVARLDFCLRWPPLYLYRPIDSWPHIDKYSQRVWVRGHQCLIVVLRFTCSHMLNRPTFVE
jgi:hypothetical protein